MSTRRFYLIGFLLLLVCDVIVQISFKLAGNHAFPPEANLDWIWRVFGHPWIYFAVVGYIGNFFIWMSLLKHAPIGPAFAATHLEVVAVMLFSVWLFNEPLTAARVVGACIIVAGIVCLALAEDGENSDDPAPVEAKGPLGVIAGD
jgi:drug/metabolite transporter (DMT)-like permease